MRAIKLLGLGLSLGLIAIQAAEAQSHDQVYHVQSSSCGQKNSRFVQSGFRAIVQGQVGLVTALHGVVGCGRVVAVQEEKLGRPYISDLTLSKVSVAHDAAFFTSPSLAQRPGTALQATGSTNTSGLKVVGYPQESVRQLDHPLEFFDSPRRTLSEQFKGSDVEHKLAERDSPSVDIEVLMVRGVLQSGYSGAPVLTSTDSVVGIANGGLAQGFAQINWVIPFDGLPWRQYDRNSPAIKKIAELDAASLFSSWTGESGIPQTGVSITGRIYYNGNPVSNTTGADAVIELVEVDTWRPVPIDFQYDNRTGVFIIRDVPPGKYTSLVRLEAGYPFNVESGGDYHARISGLNPNIVVAPHERLLQMNLEVMHGIHLKRPVDNDVQRTKVYDPPESFYQSLYAPSADIFEWDPVPGAAYYQAFILTVRGVGQPPLNVIERRLTQPQFSPGLDVSPPGTQYMFRVEAYNAANKHIGTFNNYYQDGSGGWLVFRVIPRPR